MQASLSKIQYLVGNEKILRDTFDAPVLGVFSECILEFLSDLSKSILSDASIRDYKDVVGYGYWIRKSSLKRYMDNISRRDNRLGRGLCFHIAPSNIPVQFAVSMVPALLAGNSSIIRCSSKKFKQTDILCDKINELLDNKYNELKPYICIIKYDYDDEITKMLSGVCDVRIIWGGDRTIGLIKKFETKPRTIDICFSDRYSFAIINSEELIKTDISSVVESFWTDTYYVDQNACSSPRLIIWSGNKTEKARELFWSKLEKKVKEEYDLAPIQASNKLTSFSRLAMRQDGVRVVSENNYVFRVEVKDLADNFLDYKDSGGYFFEYIANELEEIEPVIQHKSCQTIGVYGYEISEIKEMIFRLGSKGVDRIVSLGNTTAPGLDWDGFALIDTMSRYVEVE